ncbi:MAG: ABC transporter ATP-binding protein [Sarcina sp.]
MEAIIKAENLRKEYIMFEKSGLAVNKKIGAVAVNDINLEVQAGEFIAIMGPSGSGKSTLLNLISSMDTPTRGNVYIDGKKLRTMSEADQSELRYKTIGFVFQNFNLLENLTCAENITLPLTLNAVDQKTIDGEIETIAQILDVDEVLKKMPTECSGGQQQRVAIARALVANPKIIVADEPTGNLDKENSKRVMRFLRNINDERKITVLMVTHDAMIASYSDKVLYLRDGNIEKEVIRGVRGQREFFNEILELVSEDSMF